MSEMWANILIWCMIALVFLIPLRMLEDEKKLKNRRNKRNVVKETDEKYGEFLRIYDSLTRSEDIIMLENLRREVQNMTIICGSIFTLFIIIAVVIFYNIEISNSVFLFYLLSMAVVAIGIILFRIVKNKFDMYSLEYKNKFFSKFIKLIDEKMEYSNISKNNECIESAKEIYIQSGFEYDRVDEFKVDDYFGGEINGNACRIFDVEAIRIHYNDLRKREKFLFRGLFVNTQIENTLPIEIRVGNKSLLMLIHKNKVDLGDEEFKKNFIVCSDNRELVVRIFTSDVICMLNEYFEKFDVKYEFIIKKSDIYMRFYTGAMFEPMIFEKKINKELLYSYYCMLRFVIEINKKISDILENV